MKTSYILILYFAVGIMQIAKGDNVLVKIKTEIDTVVFKIHNRQADKKFYGLFYADASIKYEKLIEKNFSPDSVRRNLAIACLKINEVIKAENLFRELIQNDEAITSDYYYYAQSLKYNKKYREADVWIEKYRAIKNNDSRGELQFNAEPAIKEILEKEKYYIEPAWFNTEYSEFGAVLHQGAVVFTSGRKDQAIIKYEYSWKGDPYLDLYSTSTEQPALYKKAELLTKGINSRFHDGPLCYNSNGSEVFLTRSNFQMGLPRYSEQKENHFMLYHARSNEKGWGELIEMPFNSTGYSCGHPALSADGSTLYFASDMPGGHGESDIYYVVRKDSGWGEPVNMGPEINTEGDEMFPFASAGNELYFASNGHLGLGGLDIFMATPGARNKYTVINMGYPLNTSSDDFSFYMPVDGNTGYFASNRPGGKGDDDIFIFTMLEKPSTELKLVATTLNKRNGEILANVGVVILDGSGNEIVNTRSDVHGKIKSTVNMGGQYNFKASKESFYDKKLSYVADKSKAEKNTLYLDIPLDQKMEWGVFGLIYEKESGKGVDSVEIIITPGDKTGEITAVSDANGNFRRLLQADKEYNILMKKRKFFTRRGSFSTKNMEPGWIDIKEFIEVEMEEIVVGKTIEIPNIYYDLAKWDIRPDAAMELDKVVQFLLDNETISIELGSHTDARGSNASNQALSQKRAESAVNYIVGHGIDKSRISAKGYGESKLKNKCADGANCSEEEHQVNRRTEIMIVGF